MPARIGPVTLACRDVERMARLFRELGWPETPGDDHHRTFHCTNGVVIGLYAAKHYEPDFGPTVDGGFRAFVLSVNVGSFDECKQIHATLKNADGVELPSEPTEAFWGGGFDWRDPEGNVWDVAWAKKTTIDDRGGVNFP